MKYCDYYSVKSLNDAIRKQSEGFQFIIHRKWIPPYATIARSLDYLKVNPIRWKRGKQTARSIKILSTDGLHPLWFRVYYNVSMRSFYIESHYIQSGMDKWFGDFAYDYQTAYDIIRKQIAGW